MSLNEVQKENSLAGSPNWQLSNPAVNREIEGYASLTSVNKEDSIDFCVSTTDPNFRIEIFRTGWYQGVGARLLQTIDNLPGQVQPTPDPDSDTGLIECQWDVSHTLNVPKERTSGIFLARLTATSGKQSYILFVVRDDERKAALFYPISITTYQAYNFWPWAPPPAEVRIGKSLYDWAPGDQARKVSFDRPYTLGISYSTEKPGVALGLGAGEYLTIVQPDNFVGFSAAGFEYNMVRWLEKNGLDVTYGTNIDVHGTADLLTKYRGLLSVGHDEYWSMAIRKNIENAFANGVNLGFFSSNTGYWQVRFENSSTGAPNRTMVCYKDRFSQEDPLKGTPLSTATWRRNPVNMPEAALIGVEYVGGPVNSDIVISNSSHWLFDGTVLKNGERLKGLLGYEVDARIPGTSPDGIDILASSPAGPFMYQDFPPNWPGPSGIECNVVWYRKGNASVFATGSMQWSWGLDDYNAPQLRPAVSNPAAGTITMNLLNSFANPITITMPALLPAITAEQLDQMQFTAIGGVAPITWTASGLPPYLSMSSSGVLSGTPPAQTNKVAVNFSVTATAANGQQASKTFTLPVTPPRVISIDFVGRATAMGPSETAGVVAKANWNDAVGSVSSGALDLIDESGTNTGASVTWRSDNSWSTPITDTAGNSRMMSGYLDNGAGSPTWISVAGLPVSQSGYDVYVYVDGDNGSSTKAEQYTLIPANGSAIAATAIDAPGSNFNGTFQSANNSRGNYVRFSIEGSSFTLTATPGAASNSSPRAPVNGIQIVPR